MYRKLICLICFVFVMVFAFVGTAQAGLLLNGSFEKWTTSPLFFTHWELYPGLVPPVNGIWQWGTGAAEPNTTYKHSGNASIRFYGTSGGAGIYQGVLMSAGTSCTISAYGKQLSAAGNAGIVMIFFSGIPSESIPDPPNISRVTLDFTSFGAADVNGWRYGSITAVAPPLTQFMKFEFCSNVNSDPYDFLFDDVVGLPIPLIASNPYPDANTTYAGGNAVTLTWDPGRSAATNNGHRVYFSSVENDVRLGNPAADQGLRTPPNYPVAGLVPGTTYFWRIDEVNSLTPPNLWIGNVWRFTVQPLIATIPSPPNDANYVDPNAILSWTAGTKAATHKVYFGTTHPLTLVSNQAGTNYDPYGPAPAGKMAFDTIYYWRIDEVNGLDTWPGNEWEFRTWPNIHIDEPNLVGWWKFNEGPGDKTLDWSGHNRHGTLYGSPAFTPGIFDEAISLNGTTDWVSVGSVGISGAAKRTIAGWAKVNTTTMPAGGTIFGFAGSIGYRLFNISVSGTTGYIFNIYQWTRNIMPLDLEWHHFAATYDGTTIRYYGDGTLVGQDDYALNTIDDVRMGESAVNPNNYFPGFIDDVRIYNKVLSEADIQVIMKSPQAYSPKPANYDAEVDRNPTLTWKPGAYAAVANGHEVYFDPCEAKVVARNGCEVNDVSTTVPSYTPSAFEPLEPLKTYYWAVDEVNDSHPNSPWKGNVWRFTVPIYKVVDNFELYTATGIQNLENPTYPLKPEGLRLLRRTWIDGLRAMGWSGEPPEPTTTATSGSYVQLNTDPRDGNTPFSNKGNITQGGTKSMKFYYDNDGTIEWVNDLELPLTYLNEIYGPNWDYSTPNYYSEVSAAVDDASRISSDQNSLGMPSRDWSGYKLLKISYYGDPNNTLTIVPTDKLYVTLKDGSNRVATVTNPDQTYIKRSGWHNWYIPLSIGNGSFKAQNAALNLEDVNRIYIGIGNKASPVSGGKGAIFFDDVRLYPVSVCNSIPGALAGDFNGDCKVDANDLQKMTQVWLGQMPTPPTPVISLDASDLTLGTLSQWDNDGSAGGSFVDFNTPQPGYRPRVQMVEGVRAVVFDNNDIMKANINAPASITGRNPFTVIYKVWNLEIGNNERVFTWAKRGSTIEGKFAAVGYGTAVTYGAVGHGTVGLPQDPNFDMGFNGAPAAHTWHTIAVTYPGCSPSGPNTVETVMVDGLVNATEAKKLDIWPNCNMTVGSSYDGNSTAIPPLSQVITPTLANFFSGALANLKVYDVAIPPKDLAILMGTPIDMKVDADNRINFKDLALFANNWMVGPVLFP